MTLIRRAFLLAALTALALPAMAQEPVARAPATPLAAPAEGMVRVRLQTAQGAIVLDLNAAKAPLTTANFLRYVDQKRLDGSTFYRASRAPGDPTYGVIQGGLRNDPAKLLPPVRHESTTKTGLRHVDGTISMGRHAPGSATADFFICVGDSPYLDADPTAKGDNLGFSAFGQVVAGMEVVKAILALPTGSGGPPGMKGEMLKAPVKISAARRAG